MRKFRRLPPLLRLVNLLALLFPLASVILLVASAIMARLLVSRSPEEAWRLLLVALNLSILGGVCSFVVIMYHLRSRQPDRVPFPLGSWQSQLRAIALLAALPLCALALALMLPPDFAAFIPIAGITLLAGVVVVAAFGRF